MGPQGPEGPEGPQGAPGPQGPEGPAGPEGASPFELVGLHAVYSQGNVGIGTSSPASRLHVAGDARFDGSVTIAPTTRTHMIPAAAFQTDEFCTIGGGSNPAVIRGSEPKIVRAWAPVHLPDGAVVTGIAAGVYDDSDQDIKVNLRRSQFAQGVFGGTMGSAVSSGATGWQNPSSTSIINPVIDHSTWSYHIEIDFGSAAPSGVMSVYAVRITYTVDAPLP